MEDLIALIALTAMEIVLGIDNIVFIAIITGKLPVDQQPKARRLGLALALISRLALLGTLKWILELKNPIFELSSLGIHVESAEMNEVSVRDLILLAGGLFLIGKSVSEIHEKVSGIEHEQDAPKNVSFMSVLLQIMILDIVFSLDSVITAVGMAKEIKVMVVAVVLAVGVMLVFAEPISRFVENNPTLKVLALSFLILIGVMLTVEAVGQHVHKGYIYFAMAFALAVEMINLRVRHVSSPPAMDAENG